MIASHLPLYKHLPIDNLTGVFANTSASYKFYWFLGILDLIHENENRFAFHKVVIRMMALSWYTINFHKLSFGVQDRLALGIKTIIKESDGAIAEDASKEAIIHYLETHYKKYKSIIDSFNEQVPYYFLSPFIGTKKRKVEFRQKSIASFESDRPCPYKIVDKTIIIHPIWQQYLQQYSGILQDFTLWNFVHRFLQSRNPNIPNITEKLIERPIRKPLTQQTKLWKLFASHQPIISIYSRKPIITFDIDHYVPWSFVSHNQLWNLAPIEKPLNSSKSNKLPSKALLQGFTKQQYDFFQAIYKNESTSSNKKDKDLEDYSIIFNLSTTDIAQLPKQQFQKKLQNHITPLLQFASNAGFQSWIFEPTIDLSKASSLTKA